MTPTRSSETEGPEGQTKEDPMNDPVMTMVVIGVLILAAGLSCSVLYCITGDLVIKWMANVMGWIFGAYLALGSLLYLLHYAVA
jgi:hypothetical protein